MFHKILILLFTFLILACQNTSKVEQSTLSQKSEEKSNVFSKLSSTTGVFHKSDIDDNLVLVFDTITESNFCKWKNIDSKSLKGYFKIAGDFHPRNYKYLRPAPLALKFKNVFRPMYKLEQNDHLLVMRCEEETSVYTRWQKVSKDSFAFKNCLIPNIDTKNAQCRILEHLLVEDQVYLINQTEGGEGGSSFESIWVSKIEGDQLSILDKADIGYSHDDGDWAELSYRLIGEEIKIYEDRKVMQLDSDGWKEMSSDKKLIKTINLKYQ